MVVSMHTCVYECALLCGFKYVHKLLRGQCVDRHMHPHVSAFSNVYIMYVDFVCVYVIMYTCVCVCLFVYVCVQIYMYVCLYAHSCVNLFVYMYPSVCAYICLVCICESKCMHMHTHM